jgi:hypothetical protein
VFLITLLQLKGDPITASGEEGHRVVIAVSQLVLRFERPPPELSRPTDVRYVDHYRPERHHLFRLQPSKVTTRRASGLRAYKSPRVLYESQASGNGQAPRAAPMRQLSRDPWSLAEPLLRRWRVLSLCGRPPPPACGSLGFSAACPGFLGCRDRKVESSPDRAGVALEGAELGIGRTGFEV